MYQSIDANQFLVNQRWIIPSSVHPHRIQREKFLISWARRSSRWWSMYSNWKNPFSFLPSFNQKWMLVPVVQNPFKFKWKIPVRTILNTISWFEENFMVCLYATMETKDPSFDMPWRKYVVQILKTGDWEACSTCTLSMIWQKIKNISICMSQMI
jgi:hypothetical protein